MGMVCAVTFTKHGRLFYADPGSFLPAIGDEVLYPTDDGPVVAEVMWAGEWVSDDTSALPVLAGPAGDGERGEAAQSRKARATARVASRKLIREHNLPIKVVGIDHIVSDNKTIFYFTAPHRVDFRALIRDLGATVKGRVELRQLSARDEAKLTGGVGSCGRELCCATFLVDFEPVSVRMAKMQDLPLNPLRISGACGRLMCCLKYEHPLYQDFARDAPALGESVSCGEGEGTVVAHNVPTESVVVKLTADGRKTTCSLASVCGSRHAYEARGDTVSTEPPPVTA
jgi:cell fate regulator YaaT (PSP1 superfamily)